MRGFIVSFTIGLSLAQFQFSGANAAAQQTADTQGSFALRLNVRQVPVDVVVLDEAGNPMKGLKAGDFTVQEDGQAQKIQSFEWFDGGIKYVPPKVPKLPPNTFVNLPQGEEKGPLYIVYFDMVNMEKDDQMSFRHDLLEFLDHAPEGARISFWVNAKGLHLLQGFTTDRDLLRHAVLDRGNGQHVPPVFIYGGVYGRWDAGAALSNLRFIAHYYEGIQGKKNLLWMSSQFPIPVAATLLGTGQIPTAGAAPQAGSVGANGGPQVLDLTELMKEQVRKTYTALMRSQIAIYPVDVSGVSLGGGDALVDHTKADMIAARPAAKRTTAATIQLNYWKRLWSTAAATTR